MTSHETKKQLTKEFSGLKYILTSEMRSKLLLTIYDDSKNLDDLRNELKKPSATILHGLKELENNNLVRKVQKYYELTSNGYLITTNMIKLIENWYSVNKSKLFWNNHDLSDMPDDALKNMYLLKNAEYVNSTTSDLSNAFNAYIKQISKARKLKIILPIYSENHFRHLITLLDGNELECLELVISEELENAMRQNEYIKQSILENEKVRIKTIKNNVKLFLTISDEAVCLTLFFKDGRFTWQDIAALILDPGSFGGAGSHEEETAQSVGGEHGSAHLADVCDNPGHHFLGDIARFDVLLHVAHVGGREVGAEEYVGHQPEEQCDAARQREGYSNIMYAREATVVPGEAFWFVHHLL